MKTCEWCGGELRDGDESTCPRSLTCPTCKAGPGAPCKRPSGHKAMTLHAGRLELAVGDGRSSAPLFGGVKP